MNFITCRASTHHFVAAAHKDGDGLCVWAALYHKHLVLGGSKADLQTDTANTSHIQVIPLAIAHGLIYTTPQHPSEKEVEKVAGVVL